MMKSTVTPLVTWLERSAPDPALIDATGCVSPTMASNASLDVSTDVFMAKPELAGKDTLRSL